jgi:hypothetical protein
MKTLKSIRYLRDKIIAGQSATLILNVAQANNGTSVTHPDALMAIGKGQFTLIDSAQPGSPMMPMHGSFQQARNNLAKSVPSILINGSDKFVWHHF